MLKSLDVLIGLATVMLLASMIVMAGTQFIMAALNAKGKHLITGLSHLLKQINPGLSEDVSKRIVVAVLKSDQIKSPWGRAGTVVHREEFIKALLHLASPKSGFADQTTLAAMLKNAGIEKPEQTLDDIHTLALELEKASPELAANVRYNIAILQQAESKFVSRVHAWFDRTIDSVSERYKYHSRLVTFAMALLVALSLQLDTIQIVNRLTVDDAARQKIVSQADSVLNHNVQDEQALARYASDMIWKTGLVPMPKTVDEYLSGWEGPGLGLKLLGILLSSTLLSLGAPFWYRALADLLRLRSVAAQKDDVQRAARTVPPEPAVAAAAAAAAPALSPDWVRGEQGNLQLVG